MTQSPLPSADLSKDADVAEYLARFAAGLDYSRLPPAVVSAVKTLVLDALGNAVAGSAAPGVDVVHQQVREWAGAPQSRVWVHGTRVPAPQAALVNGTMSHAAEFDDLHDEAHVHSLAVILPAVLAVAELLGGVDGSRLIAAVAVGTEIMCRLGLAAPCERGWHYTSTFGVFGAAAAAANLMGLGETGVRDALGVAYSYSGGTKQGLIESRLVKRLHPGIAAQAGITAALLARGGITGPMRPFDGTFGYFALYEDAPVRRDRVLDELGSRYELTATRLKPYPCCGYNHAAIDAALSLAGQVPPDAVKEVVVIASATTLRLVGAPFQLGQNPQADAQFSLPYTVAAALIRGKVFLDDFEEAAICDAAVFRLAGKVRVLTDPAIPERAVAPASVTITTRDGRVLTARGEHTRGGPEAPLSGAERAAKLRRCLAFGGLADHEDRAERLTTAVGDLEKLPDATLLVDLIAGGAVSEQAMTNADH